MSKNFKIARFVKKKKNAKISDGKTLKPLQYHYKLRSNLFLKPKGGSLTRRFISSTSKSHPSHHKYKYESPKQFQLKQSSKALRALNARWALPVYPVFEDEKSKASAEKLVQRKMA